MTNDKQKEYLHGLYVGKEFIKKSSYVDKTSKERVEFSQVKVMIKRRESDNFPVKIGCASFCKGFDELEEGEYFTIGYTLSEPMFNAKANKEIQYKNGFFIKKITQDEAEANNANTSHNTQASGGDTTTKTNPSNGTLSTEDVATKLDVFNDAFRKMLEKNDRLNDYTKEQFMASFFLFLHKDHAKQAMEFFKVAEHANNLPTAKTPDSHESGDKESALATNEGAHYAPIPEDSTE